MQTPTSAGIAKSKQAQRISNLTPRCRERLPAIGDRKRSYQVLTSLGMTVKTRLSGNHATSDDMFENIKSSYPTSPTQPSVDCAFCQRKATSLEVEWTNEHLTLT